MALEQTQVDSKLQAEGLDTQLATGISFENEEALKSWVDLNKTAAAKPAGLESYTIDQLREMADSGKMKNLQSFADTIRTETLNKKAQTTLAPSAGKGGSEDNPLLKSVSDLKATVEGLTQKLSAFEQEKKINNRDSLIDKYAKGFKPEMIDLLKRGMKSDATEADIKSEVEKQKKWMTAENFKGFVVENPSKNKKGEDSDTQDSVKRIMERKAKLNKK